VDTYPDPVRAYLTTVYGTPTQVETLAGLSHAQVWRVRFAHQSVVVKANTRAREVLFYETVAPHLRVYGVPVPQLEWSVCVSGSTSIILEDISLPFPQTRWLADPEQLAILRQLHRSSFAQPRRLPGAFRPQWTERMTHAALKWFPRHTACNLMRVLHPFQMAAQHLFLPRCPISGDPNPTNWGLRRDGTLVLYDWERFGWGTPAIDLAITIPGLHDLDTFRAVAAGYLPRHDEGSVEHLAQHIVIAKVWSVVEFLSMFSGADNAPANIMMYLQQAFPPWLDRMTNTHD
jgi:aminoglycoside phosphotransferase (APT) family kinase protein